MHFGDEQEETFRRELEPFFAMLEDKEADLSKEEWVILVNSIKDRVLIAPDQFLSGISRPEPGLEKTIDNIFRERLN